MLLKLVAGLRASDENLPGVTVISVDLTYLTASSVVCFCICRPSLAGTRIQNILPAL
jgi:hypothetical protein